MEFDPCHGYPSVRVLMPRTAKVLEPLGGWVDLSDAEGMRAAPYPYHISLGYTTGDWAPSSLSRDEIRELRRLDGICTEFKVESISYNWTAMLDNDHWVFRVPVVAKCHAADWHCSYSVSM